MLSRSGDRCSPFFLAQACVSVKHLGFLGIGVDFAANGIRVEKQLAHDTSHFYMQDLKTEQSRRVIPMSSTVRAALLDVKQREQIACLVDGCSLVFQGVAGSGKAIRRSTVFSAMMRIIKAWNSEHPQDSLPMCSPHSLRHSFITRLAESGTDVNLVSTLAGHGTIKTTLDIYTSLSSQHLHKNTDKLEGIFQPCRSTAFVQYSRVV